MASGTIRVNLKELAVRESEQVEWKEDVADIDKVVETLTAFANDWSNLGGGYVVCGAREGRDEYGFATVLTPGLTAERFKEVEGKVLTRCRDRVTPPITPIVDELPGQDPSRRILIFIMPATDQAHCFRRKTDSGKYYIRRGRRTEEARNGLYRELLVRKGAREPWDRRVHPEATIEDIDLLALRDTLQDMSLWDHTKTVDEYLSDTLQIATFVYPLCAREPLTGRLRPRNFTLLLFGKNSVRFFPGAYTIFSRYSGTERVGEHIEQLWITGPLIVQIRKLLGLLETQAHVKFSKQHLDVQNVTKYPWSALKEAMVNALVHRDYASDDPVRVTVFQDRIEFFSPGGLPTKVNQERFLSGRATPVWRNQSFAWLCLKLDVSQGAGQGVPRIFTSLRDEGCPPPEFYLGPESVECVISANPRTLEGTVIVNLERAFDLPEPLKRGPVFTIPDPERLHAVSPRLRASPVDGEAWRTVVKEIEHGVARALERSRGPLHIFATLPYAAAVLLGRCLDDLARARMIYLYQFTPDATGWALFSERDAGLHDDCEPYHRPLIEPDDVEGRTSALIAVEGESSISEEHLQRLGKTLNAAVYHLSAERRVPMLPGQAGRAKRDLRQALVEIKQRYPATPLHIVATAPIALMIEFGRLLSPTTWSSAIVYHFVPTAATDPHQPVLDVIKRRPAENARLDDKAESDVH